MCTGVECTPALRVASTDDTGSDAVRDGLDGGGGRTDGRGRGIGAGLEAPGTAEAMVSTKESTGRGSIFFYYYSFVFNIIYLRLISLEKYDCTQTQITHV